MSTKVIIVYKHADELAETVRTEMKNWLIAKDYTVVDIDSYDCTALSSPHGADFAVSLGGDGTFLSCARMLGDFPIPILPVHLGSFGFITEVNHSQWESTLEAWIKGDLRIEERMILNVSVERKGKILKSFYAINDAVIGTDKTKLVRLSLTLASCHAGLFRGDGLIISTPSGSTAYSMAAGGPILVPPMNAILLTPICPFSLSWRPLVLPDWDTIEIRVDSNQRTNVQLTLDGQERMELMEKDRILLSGSTGGAKIIKTDKWVFYDVVRDKLGWSEGPDA